MFTQIYATKGHFIAEFHLGNVLDSKCAGWSQQCIKHWCLKGPWFSQFKFIKICVSVQDHCLRRLPPDSLAWLQPPLGDLLVPVAQETQLLLLIPPAWKNENGSDIQLFLISIWVTSRLFPNLQRHLTSSSNCNQFPVFTPSVENTWGAYVFLAGPWMIHSPLQSVLVAFREGKVPENFSVFWSLIDKCAEAHTLWQVLWGEDLRLFS